MFYKQLVELIPQSDKHSLLVTQNYEALVAGIEESALPANPIIERKKSGFDPFDPISVKLMTLGETCF